MTNFHPWRLTSLLFLLLAAFAVGLAACAPADDPGSSGGAGSPLPVFDVDGLVASAPDIDGSAAAVQGFLLVVGDDARLCALILESYPPQCGGAAIVLTGTIPADVMAGLDSTSEPTLAQASWGDVLVSGTVDAGADGSGPTMTIGSIELIVAE